MAEGHRRDGVRTFADTAANGEVAPKAAIAAAAARAGVRTQSGHFAIR